MSEKSARLRAQRGVHLPLRTLREAAGKTQVDVGQASQIDQADISRLESRERFDDAQVATLQRYIAALGGELELVAAFGNKRIILTGAKPGPTVAPSAEPSTRKTGSAAG